jgi:hypothetical protein
VSRLHVSLGDVPSEVRCAKPSCEVVSHTRLQRHHKRHPKMWFGIWAKRRRGETRFKEFIERYNMFLPEDVTLICDEHHAEIHSIYDEIITKDRAQTQTSLTSYTWVQATRLMNKLEAACNEWLKKQTAGIDSGAFGETRNLRRAILKKKARRHGRA